MLLSENWLTFDPCMQGKAGADNCFILQNGFSIDDGELREYTNPQNREFLASIMKGTRVLKPSFSCLDYERLE